MKRCLIGIIFCASALVWVLVLFIAVEHLRGSWALNHRENVLKSRGEILSVSSLEPNHPPASQNAAIGLLSLSNRLAAVTSNLDNTPPMFRLTLPGHAIVAWRLKEWSREGKTTNDWTTVGRELESSADLIDQIRESLEKPSYDSGFDYQTGVVSFRLPPIATLRHAAQILSIAEVYELSRGQLEPAHRHLRAVIRLVAVQRPEPLMIAQMVRYACAAYALGATWQALQTEGWTDSQLASIQSAWQACDFVHDMAAAMEMERALSLDFYEQIKESNEKLNLAVNDRVKAEEMLGGAFSSFATDGFILRRIHVPLWQLAWADQGEVFDLNEWQLSIERERMVRTNGWAALAERVDSKGRALPWSRFMPGKEKLNRYDKVRLLFAADNPGLNDNIIRRTLSIQTQQQMVLAAIAIERHRVKKGRLPAELSALIPEYLPALPRDGMDGKALRYRLTSNGAFQLYSVGLDGKDNGGDPTPLPSAHSYAQMWDGRDAVWPTAATAEEAQQSLRLENKGR